MEGKKQCSHSFETEYPTFKDAGAQILLEYKTNPANLCIAVVLAINQGVKHWAGGTFL